MIYKIKFKASALKEWNALDRTIQQQFAKKLEKCTENPHISSAKLRGMPNCYKIKLRASGFRLVYQVIDDELVVTVVSVGKRENNEAYFSAKKEFEALGEVEPR